MRLFRERNTRNPSTLKYDTTEINYTIAEMIELKIEDAAQLSEDQIRTLHYKIEEQSKLIGFLFQKLYDNKAITDVEIISLLPYDMKFEE